MMSRPLNKSRRIDNGVPVLPENAVLVSSIKGYESCVGYAVDKNGNFYSCKAHNFKPYMFCDKWSLFKLKNNRHGYPYVIMSIFGKDITAKIHKLVALAFVPNPCNFPVINHKDGIKTNNNYYNLEWCTHSYNSNHYIGLGIRDTAKGSRIKCSKLNEISVSEIKIALKNGERRKDLSIKYKIDLSVICLIANNKLWKHVSVPS